MPECTVVSLDMHELAFVAQSPHLYRSVDLAIQSAVSRIMTDQNEIMQRNRQLRADQ